MRIILTPTQRQYIRQHFRIESKASMAKRFGMSESPIKRFMNDNGLTPSKQDQFNIYSNSQSTATLKEDHFIEKHYLTMPLKVIGKKLNRSDVFIRTRMDVLGLKVPREIVEQRKHDSRIKPGNIPPNKGKKMPKALYKKCSPTMFKPGQLPKNTLFDGAVRIRQDHKDGRFYKWIRIKVAVWIPLHRYNYKKYIGIIPPKHVVTFKDGDSLNCDPSNLMLITMAQNAERNRDSRYPAEVREVIRLNNKLKKQIHAKKQNRGSAQVSKNESRPCRAN